MPTYIVSGIVRSPTRKIENGEEQTDLKHRAALFAGPNPDGLKDLATKMFCPPNHTWLTFEAKELTDVPGFIPVPKQSWTGDKLTIMLTELAKLPKDAADRILDLATDEARLTSR